MVRAPAKAFQVGVGWHPAHVMALERHCERRMSR
jgi:hypothetical protein